MRVAFAVIEYHPRAAGGAERQAKLQADELTRRGHEVTVLCPRYRGTRSGMVGEVRVIRLPTIDRRPFGRLTHAVSLFLWIMLSRRKIDVVHVHVGGMQADVAVLAGRLSGVRTYVKVAAGGASGEVLRRRQRRNGLWRWTGLRGANAVQALSSEIESELEAAGVPRERIARIPNGIPLPARVDVQERRAEARNALRLPQDVEIAVYIGRFATYKGAADLLDAWRQVGVNSTRRLIMVGTLDTEDAIDSIPELPHLAVRPWTDVPERYLAAADLYVHPAHADGMSNALLEAMALETPVVAAATPPTLDLLRPGVDAFCFEPRDPTDLARVLDVAFADGARRRRYAAAARAKVEGYSISEVAKQIEQRYAQLV